MMTDIEDIKPEPYKAEPAVEDPDGDHWNGLQEGDIVEVVGGLGDIGALPTAKVVGLGYKFPTEEISPTVTVRYIDCINGEPDDCIHCQRYDGHCRHQSWYPHQLEKVEGNNE